MGTYQELLDGIKSPKQCKEIRIDLIKQIEGKTGRNLIVYAADFVKPFGGVNSINLSDKTGFSDLIEGLDKEEKEELDVFIQSPGGSAEVAEQLVRILRHKFPQSIRFIIPHSTKSAATMMVLSGNQILMDHRSELGPIDPQIAMPVEGGGVRFVPAETILKGFEDAKNVLLNSPEEIIAYTSLLRKYDLHLFKICENAQKLSKELTRKWLETYMFSEAQDNNKEGKISKAIEYFAEHKEHKSHSRAIGIGKVKELGLNVFDLNGDPELQKLFWKLYCAIEIFFDRTSAVKIFENSHGTSFSINVSMAGPRPPKISPKPPSTPPPK